jgi:predicted SAM-dependent methyltransferase
VGPAWRRMLARIQSAFINPLQSTLSEHQSTLSEHQSTLSEHQSKLSEHQSTLSEHQSTLSEHQSTLSEHQSTLSSLLALELGWNQHSPAVLNAVSTVGALGHELRRQHEQIACHEASVSQLWQRLELIRNEILFEIKYGRTYARSFTNRVKQNQPQPRVLSPAKLAVAGDNVRLNLGCGDIPLDEYINVDARELAGVDIVADVGSLPFQSNTVQEIASAHLLDHFPQEMLRRNLLPYWRSLLTSGGRFSAIVPDGQAMLAGTAASTYSFAEFREVLFGSQDYDGDFHYNIFTPESLTRLVQEAGFTDVEISVRGRPNGKCFEFQLVASRP